MEPAQTDHASGFDGQQSKSCKPLLHRVDLMVVYQKAWYRRIQLAHIFACTGRRSLIQRHLASSEPMDTIRQHNTPIRKDAQVQASKALIRRFYRHVCDNCRAAHPAPFSPPSGLVLGGPGEAQ